MRRKYLCESIDGRKRLLVVLIFPSIIIGSLFMLIIGGIWARYVHYRISILYLIFTIQCSRRLLTAECGYDIASAKFSIYSDDKYWYFTGNRCPGYDWIVKSNILTAGEFPINMKLLKQPQISSNKLYLPSISGIIGISVNGLPILSPYTSTGDNLALQQKSLLDRCGGFITPPSEYDFNIPITGYYNYLLLPGLNAASLKTDVDGKSYIDYDDPLNYCDDSLAWYNSAGVNNHSALAGFMIDGIPIYGPYTAGQVAPSDLDDCGGHSSDLGYYHYHYQVHFPYSVKCLVACPPDGLNSDLVSKNCIDTNKGNIGFNFTALESLTISYGGEGINTTNSTGPGTLLSFGAVILLGSLFLCCCIKQIPNKADDTGVYVDRVDKNKDGKKELVKISDIDDCIDDNVL